MKYQNTWDMESVFAGGSDSPIFYEKVSSLKEDLVAFDRAVKKWDVNQDAPNFEHFQILLENRESIEKGIGEARTFMSGLSSADVTDSKARINLNVVSNLSKDLSNSLIPE